MKSLQEQIKEIEEEAKKKINQLKAKQELLEAKKLNALLKKDRASDTRRKILAGAFVLDAAEKDDASKTKLMNGLNKFLTRDDDRILFGLEPLQKSETQEKTQPTETPKQEKSSELKSN